jgi:hypothetical protein
MPIEKNKFSTSFGGISNGLILKSTAKYWLESGIVNAGFIFGSAIVQLNIFKYLLITYLTNMKSNNVEYLKYLSPSYSFK